MVLLSPSLSSIDYVPADEANMTGHTSHLLALPIEVRELVYNLIFDPTTLIKVEAAAAREYEYAPATETDSTTWPADFESWAITRHPLSSQLLRACTQIHEEATPFLYSRRTFDLTARESLKLLFHNIGHAYFEHIRHVLIDWDSLEDFSRSLNKDEYQVGTSGLKSIQLASWRIRHIQGTSVRWRSVKGYERMVCQAAVDITEKHKQLKLVAEQAFQRKSSYLSVDAPRMPPSNCRVKWRFITHEADLKEGENVIDIKEDLGRLGATQDEASDGGFALPRIDPR